jgi:hypothetical protein
MSSFKGETDNYICKKVQDGDDVQDIPYSFIKGKTKWDLPTPSEGEDLVQWWHADVKYEAGKGSSRPGKSIYQEVTQIYTYMSVNNLRYGVMTTYERTWFLCRPKDGDLLISDAIDCAGSSPTLLQKRFVTCFPY